MTPQDVEALFTRSSGEYTFARWGRPIVPVVFGVQDEALPVIKGAVEAVVQLAGHEMAETDPELGTNFMMFFFSNWDELLEVPKLDELVPDLKSVVNRLQKADAGQYRAFRFDDDAAIMACFAFVRMTTANADVPADTLALTQAVNAIVLWSDTAFKTTSPLAVLPDDGGGILKPEIGAVIAAAYQPLMPVADRDPSHALRLYARISKAEVT